MNRPFISILTSFYTSSKSRWVGLSSRNKSIIIIVAVLIIGGGTYLLFGQKTKTAVQVTVKRGTIVEQVTVTGNTSPIGNVDLSFQTSGIVTKVSAPVASTVSVGDALVSLDTSTLRAQLAGARANLDAAQARLNSLRAGATPQTIAVSQASVDTANQTLANGYTSAYSALTQAYASAQDATQAKLDSYFQNPQGPYPNFIFSSGNGVDGPAALADKPRTVAELLIWQSELATLNPNSPPSAIDAELIKANTHLHILQKFVSEMSGVASYASNFPAASGLSVSTLQAAVSAGANEISTTQTALNTAMQTIQAEKAGVAQAQAALNQASAGATTNDITAQQAAVEAAQATVTQINTQITQATLRSPISGVVSVQNAKVGQLASPGATLVTVISKDNLEVDADLPETDIGKVNVNNTVAVTFDAFPGETFNGTVFYIDPAETIIGGVVNYKIKIAFAKPDPRIKSGLTANLSITTNTKTDVLILPQFAILQNDNGSFVEIQTGKKVTQVPVTTGIQDIAGNIEIKSGVTEGESVLNVGLK